MECKICKKEIDEELCQSCREYQNWKENEGPKIDEEDFEEIDDE